MFDGGLPAGVVENPKERVGLLDAGVAVPPGADEAALLPNNDVPPVDAPKGLAPVAPDVAVPKVFDGAEDAAAVLVLSAGLPKAKVGIPVLLGAVAWFFPNAPDPPPNIDWPAGADAGCCPNKPLPGVAEVVPPDPKRLLPAGLFPPRENGDAAAVCVLLPNNGWDAGAEAGPDVAGVLPKGEGADVVPVLAKLKGFFCVLSAMMGDLAGD